MCEYVFSLGEFSGSDFLELRKGYNVTDHKFTRQDSLYVLDNAFFLFLEVLFRDVVDNFDMFENTYMSKSQWQLIMKLDLKEFVYPDDFDVAMQTLSDINDWVEVHVDNDSGFTVIGV